MYIRKSGMIIAHGSAFTGLPPSFMVVSIYDQYPPGPEWTKSTSLRAFSQQVGLSLKNFNNANCATITSAWHWMLGLATARGHANVQTYYRNDAHPVPVFKVVHLVVGYTPCCVVLVHAPDFKIMTHGRAMSLLVSLYRMVHEMCAMRGGRAADARMSPLCAGEFKTKAALPEILRTCIDELLTPTSAPITVYGFDVAEYDTLMTGVARRVKELGLTTRRSIGGTTHSNTK